MSWKAHMVKAKKKRKTGKISLGIRIVKLDTYIAHQVSENFQLSVLLCNSVTFTMRAS